MLTPPPSPPPSPALRGVYVDHGEAYGNLGEEAMILNGIRRIQEQLRPGVIHVTHPAGFPLPVSDLPGVTDNPGAFWAFYATAQRLAGRLRRLPGLRGVEASRHEARCWRLMMWLDRWFPRRLGVRAHPEVVRFLAALEGCEVYYHIGMSGFNDYWEPGLLYKRWVVQQARQRVKLVVLSSQGLGPITRRAPRRILQGLLRQTDLVSLRDRTYGLKLLQSLRYPADRCRVVFDEAFSLPPAPADQAAALLSRAGVAADTRFVAFHYRDRDYTQAESASAARATQLAERLQAESGLQLVFIPMSYAGHSTIDRDLGLELARRLGQPAWFHVLEDCRQVSLLKAVIGRARFSAGMSYHVNVFSLTQGHPALVLFTGGYYALKSEELISFYGPPSRALDVHAAPLDAVGEAVRELLAGYDEACARIREVNARLAEVNDWTLHEIKRRLALPHAG